MAGRRSGKTEYVTYWEILPYLLLENQNIWIVAPTYDLTSRVWDMLYGKIIREFKKVIKSINTTRGLYRIETYRGTVIEAKSGDDPQSLVGKGLDLLVIDEAGILKEKCWKESLRPSLADRQGKAVFIGTPKGKNWFYNMYLKGQDPAEKDYESWQFSTADNDSCPQLITEMEEAKRNIPEMEYNQEWLAQFIDDSGQVFRNIHANIFGQLEEPIQGESYVIGVDWAKTTDFTVMCVGKRSTRSVVAFERFNTIDYQMQMGRLRLLSEKYNNAYILMDQSGPGEPILDQLKNLNIEGYKTGVPNDKALLINSLALEIESGGIHYPNIPVLINELDIFDYMQLPSGAFRYAAPEGMHDDCVIALALMNHAFTQGQISWGRI